jgi:hypothetical protein
VVLRWWAATNIIASVGVTHRGHCP